VRVQVVWEDGDDALRDGTRRVLVIAEDVLNLFIQKTKDYGDTAEHLGSRGQYADMWRKMGKLKRALWDGIPMINESAEEMVMDLIGHCLLTIDFLRRNQ
jgi:hypothetical protein